MRLKESNDFSSEDDFLDYIGRRGKDDLWKGIMAPLYEVVSATEFSDLGISGEIESRLFGSALIGRSLFQSHQCIRTSRLIREGGIDQVLLQVIVTGVFKGQFGDKEILACAGDIIIMDYSKPFNLLVSDGETLSFAFDRSALSKMLNPQSLHGAVIKGDTPLGIMLANMVSTSLNIVSQGKNVEPYSIEVDVIEFIARSLVYDKKINSINIDLQRQSIIDFIDLNIYNQKLDPGFIMDKFHISRAHLYRLFEEDGGVSKIIWDRRLDAAYQEVSKQKSNKKVSIKYLAYKYGCLDANQFSKRFSKKYSLGVKDVFNSSVNLIGFDGGLMQIQKHFANSKGDGL